MKKTNNFLEECKTLHKNDVEYANLLKKVALEKLIGAAFGQDIFNYLDYDETKCIFKLKDTNIKFSISAGKLITQDHPNVCGSFTLSNKQELGRYLLNFYE